MRVANATLLIDDQESRHPPKFEQVDLLLVLISHGMAGVGQPDEGQAFALPVAPEDRQVIRLNCQDRRVTRGKGREVVSQAGEMRAAVGSKEAAQEDQNDVFVAAEAREPHRRAAHIGKVEVDGQRVAGKNGHLVAPSLG
jgi:hypothetical protein